MKLIQRFVAMLGISFLVLASGNTVLAETTSNQPVSTSPSTTTTTKPETTLQSRLEVRKAALKTKLSTVEQAKIKRKCTAAQAVVKGVDQRLTNIRANHIKAYETIDANLTTLVIKLEDKNADTTALKAQQAELAKKVTSFKTDVETYQQTLSDISTMDCISDPTAFKASLETARTIRDKLKVSAADIRSYYTQTIKKTLAEIRVSIAANKGTAGEGN